MRIFEGGCHGGGWWLRGRLKSGSVVEIEAQLCRRVKMALQNRWDERGEVRERVRQWGIEREWESTWKLGAFRRGGTVCHRRGGAFCRCTSVVGGWEWEEFEIFLEMAGCFHAGAEIFWRVNCIFFLFGELSKAGAVGLNGRFGLKELQPCNSFGIACDMDPFHVIHVLCGQNNSARHVIL